MVTAKFQDGIGVSRRNAATQVAFELLPQRGNTLLASPPMPDRIIHHETLGLRTVHKKNLQAVPDRARRRIEVIDRELLIFGNLHLFPEAIDPRVRGNVILVVGGRQAAKNERHCDHVLEAMVSIRRIVQRSSLIDDSLTAFLCFNENPRNRSESLRNLFEVDARFITLATLHELLREGKIQPSLVQKAIKDLAIDVDKADPFTS